MKIIKKIMTCLVLVSYFHAIDAKNKQQIFLNNEYNEDVLIKVTWQSTSFPYFFKTEPIQLREHDKHLMLKAPYSYYKLVGLSASTQESLDSNIDLIDYDLPYEIPLIASNEDVLDEKHVGNNTYFIIKASHKDSDIPGQKKIYIQGYTSQQKYAAQTAKITEQEKFAQAQQYNQQKKLAQAQQKIQEEKMMQAQKLQEVQQKIQNEKLAQAQQIWQKNQEMQIKAVKNTALEYESEESPQDNTDLLLQSSHIDLYPL